ncbi:hypothetical protein SASPL_112050 [Salvia splendens]|uniref:Zinc finger PHD-type domain-containing protein n=1 Tax=Salvia splendens TaxID=180675 RepID=A0A8X8YDP7_SALSN|nr:hypothetical protein SASPL_112050 [Salvia splendens]
MPCLSNLINSPPSALPDLKPILYDKAELQQGPIANGLNPEFHNPPSFDEDGGGDIHTKIPKLQWLFLVGAPKLIQCGVCRSGVYPEEKILCTVRGCKGVFHLICAKESLGFSSSKENQFKCPQHSVNEDLHFFHLVCGQACFLCKQKNHLWRCIRCLVASHDKCAAFPEHVVRIPNQPGEVICWKHPTDWRLEKHEVPANITKDIFSLLPLPYTEQEFKIDINWKDQAETKLEPRSYVHIKRSILCTWCLLSIKGNTFNFH